MAYAIGAGIIGLLVFLLLQPKIKALVSFFLMMQFFDAGPNIVFGYYAWDYGAILMLITGADVYLRRPLVPAQKHLYIFFLRIFVAWLFVCFFWSLLVYQYPLMHTIKNARYMVVGYLMTFIFIRLFSVQPDSFSFLMRWFYRLTFVLMIVLLVQFIIQKQILFGLFREYEGLLRAVPIFLPICLLNFWIIIGKFLAGEKLKSHEFVYMLLTATIVALSFTRGIYVACILTGLLLLWITSKQGRLKATSVLGVVATGILLIGVMLATGVAGTIVDRAAQGLALIGSGGASVATRTKDDTFNGRLGLMSERFELATSHNPVVGFGFIHEDDVPSEIRSHLKFGTALSGTAEDPDAYTRSYAYSESFVLGFYSADIAWADIVISTGLVGVALLLAVVLSFVYEFFSTLNASHPMGVAVRVGFFLQFIMLFLLTFDGSYFFSSEHLIAFLLAGSSLTGARLVPALVTAPRASFENIL